MIRIIFFIIVLFLFSCDPGDEDRQSCYSFINGIDRDVVLEFYSYNSGQNISTIGTYSLNGMGLLNNFCKSSRRALGPVSVIRMDSIIVKFDNTKKITYLKVNELGFADFLYHVNDYTKEGETFNYSYTFTEEDYNNAIPF
ncbi:hypothetical protein [Nonlabens sp. SY33080]|uniref:hypothetical protein n=1 Tax=Nonlabens sp. SY33080 TaxID=2719911 RepID=UPI0014288E58|nr:hypothetical protein [Nonlabens sp. SY33080]